MRAFQRTRMRTCAVSDSCYQMRGESNEGVALRTWSWAWVPSKSGVGAVQAEVHSLAGMRPPVRWQLQQVFWQAVPWFLPEGMFASARVQPWVQKQMQQYLPSLRPEVPDLMFPFFLQPKVRRTVQQMHWAVQLQVRAHQMHQEMLWALRQRAMQNKMFLNIRVRPLMHRLLRWTLSSSLQRARVQQLRWRNIYSLLGLWRWSRSQVCASSGLRALYRRRRFVRLSKECREWQPGKVQWMSSVQDSD